MALEVEQKDIAENSKSLGEMENEYADSIKLKDLVLKKFEAKMKVLDDDAKKLKEVLNGAANQVNSQKDLQKEVEQRLAGKRKADLEKDDDRKVKFFIKIVEKQEWPKFDKVLKNFQTSLQDIMDSLK